MTKALDRLLELLDGLVRAAAPPGPPPQLPERPRSAAAGLVGLRKT